MATTYLATVIGWYLVILNLYMLLKPEHAKSIISEVSSNRGTFFILALFTLILGLMMVTSHNIWAMQWHLLITLFSWMVLIAGIIRLFSPETSIKMGASFFNSPLKMKVSGVFFLLIGLFLLYQVYSPRFLG